MKTLFTFVLIIGCTLALVGCSDKNESNTPKQDIIPLSSSDQNQDTETTSKYDISEEEEKAFFDAVQPKFEDEGQFNTFKEELEQLKELYKEGYYIVIKVGTKAPGQARLFYDTATEQNGSRMNFLVHELTHVGSIMCFARGQEISESENIVCEGSEEDAKKYAFLTSTHIVISPYESELLFTNDELRQYIENLTDTDNTYLNAENGDLFGILDELNAYTKSIRLQRAYRDIDPPEQLFFEYNALQRQIYYLSLYIKHARENDPEAWEYLTSKKEVAYIVNKILTEATIEITKIDVTSFTENSEFEDVNTELKASNDGITENKEKFEEFNKAAGITDEEKTYSYTNEAVSEMGLEVIPVP